MLSYMDYKFVDDESFIESFDEAPLWSSAFGLFMLKYLELRKGMTVVDVGCGTGFPLFELAGRLGEGTKLYGVDPWQNAMKRAKKKLRQYGYRNIELIESTAENIPLENNSVDLITSNLGINNFE